MRIVFMGTPIFAQTSLEALIGAGHDVCGVFTQPDKPKNRGKQIQMSPVKECALAHSIPVYQPQSLRRGEDAQTALDALKELAPECIVVAAYGQILPKEVLELPKYGCINIHASLLPKYRGAAPIQRAIQNGEKETGITTMYMAEGLDTGDMIMKAVTEIAPEMTGSELHDRLSEMGAGLILETLQAVENGTAVRTPQEGESSYAAMITKEELKIDFTKPAREVYNYIRAMSAVPCAYTILDGKRLKVYGAKIGEKSDAEVGTIANAERFSVVCGDGECVELCDVQLEGAKRMALDAFLRGKKLELGAVLG